MRQMQVMGEATGLCVAFCSETVTNLTFLHWEVESFCWNVLIVHWIRDPKCGFAILFMKKISVLYVCVYGCFSCYSRLMILVLLYLFLLVQYQISFLKLGDYK